MSHAGLGLVSTRSARLFDAGRPLQLACGRELAPVDVAYETYGELAPDGANAVFVCHALTGDAHAAGHHGQISQRGWWDTIIGSGRPLDTDRYFVVCANLLGGCAGTTGPSSIDPATGSPYGLGFPMLSVGDLVAVHRALLEHLGITRLHAAIGGSLGGMQALQWALDHPGEIGRAILICASARLSAQNIGLSAVARAAILGDPDFQSGKYLAGVRRPERGLALARRIGHITYLSEESMRRKFDRRRRGGPDSPMTFSSDFEVEFYLDHQGESFIRRFDALSYLYLTRVMDYFDPFAQERTSLERLGTRFLILSFDSDWRFGLEHSRFMLERLTAGGAQARHVEIASPWGHDSFLLEIEDYHRLVAEELAAPAAKVSSSAIH